MTEKLYAMIEAERTRLEGELVVEMDRRDEANAAIKAIRAQLDELPVRKTRRPKKTSTAEGAVATSTQSLLDV